MLGDDVERLLVAHSIDDYIDKAVAVALSSEPFRGPHTGGSSPRTLVCERKHLLFDEDHVRLAAEEWKNFLLSVG